MASSSRMVEMTGYWLSWSIPSAKSGIIRVVSVPRHAVASYRLSWSIPSKPVPEDYFSMPGSEWFGDWLLTLVEYTQAEIGRVVPVAQLVHRPATLMGRTLDSRAR